MRNKFIIFLLLMAAGLSGCIVQSINRFYTNDLKVELKEIRGKWKLLKDPNGDVSEEDIKPWVFSDSELLTVDNKNRSSRFDIVVFKVEDTFFIDFMASSPENESEYWSYAVAPKHILARLDIDKENGRLVLTPLDYEWFEERIKNKDKDLKFVQAEEDYEIPQFTLSSLEWVAFLKKHLNDKGMFSYKHRIILSRIAKSS